jgi:hypothetical protein
VDRARRRPGRLIALLAVVGLAAAAPPPAPPLKAVRWLAPGADPAAAFARSPTECLAEPADAETAYEVELGWAAFRTPLLLGGQAARAGISCETCHRSGRNNPLFDFRGVSGAPGTADVTTPVLSSHRGDDVFDPKPIPDLSGPKTALKVSQDPASDELETHIDGIVTQEFDGAEPSTAVRKGLAAYVRALSPEACPKAATQAVTAESALGDVRRTLAAALAALDRKDGASAALMVEAARSQLGDIDERYSPEGSGPARAALGQAGRDLGAAALDCRRDDLVAAKIELTLWLAAEPRWARAVIAAEPDSLYNPARLAAAVADYEKRAAVLAKSSTAPDSH